MLPMVILPIEQDNRTTIDAFIVRQWFSLQMVVHGEVIDMSAVDGWYAFDYDNIVGLITYRIVHQEMEILSLDSMQENKGVGSALLGQAIAKAKIYGCSRIWLITTNDNLSALLFYQKRGFEIVYIHYNAVDEARKLKPSIPLFGNNGIPIHDEIELEMVI